MPPSTCSSPTPHQDGVPFRPRGARGSQSVAISRRPRPLANCRHSTPSTLAAGECCAALPDGRFVRRQLKPYEPPPPDGRYRNGHRRQRRVGRPTQTKGWGGSPRSNIYPLRGPRGAPITSVLRVVTASRVGFALRPSTRCRTAEPSESAPTTTKNDLEPFHLPARFPSRLLDRLCLPTATNPQPLWNHPVECVQP